LFFNAGFSTTTLGKVPSPLISNESNLDLDLEYEKGSDSENDNYDDQDFEEIVSIKPVSIPIQSGKSIFVEYRTPSEYYSGTNSVLVYFVDTSIWHGSGPYKLVAVLQKKGDSVVFENQTIRLFEIIGDEVFIAINS
jgi:hypothetical protein